MKGSTNEKIKNVAISNDLTKKDREREFELVAERNQKKFLEVGPWKFVIRGPPGNRKLQKNKKTSINRISKLKCMYTNCDTLTNKICELKLAIDSNDPDVIVLSEVTPKKQLLHFTKIKIEINTCPPHYLSLFCSCGPTIWRNFLRIIDIYKN